MPLLKLKVPPGVNKNGTEYSVGGRWFDANLIRWNDGLMMPVGGWDKLTASTFTGKCRGLFAWKDNSFNRYIAFGTSSKLYVWNDSGNYYDITPSGFTAGRDDSLYGLGYGALNYGASTYGDVRAGGMNLLAAATWQFDNWGEYLIGCAPHDGKIYQWALNTAAIATAVTNAPVNNRAAFVTPERHLVALGAGNNPRKVQWSDQEVHTTWTPSATNSAGSMELQTNGTIQAAVKVRNANLIFTDIDVHLMQHLGLPFVYSVSKAGSNCGLVGPKAVATASTFAAWMTDSEFFIFDGSVKPLPCEVQDYVFNDINRVQYAKVYAGLNSNHSEVWWFYPSASSTENDRYVTWNYAENHWSIGTLARTAWVDGIIRKFPTAAGTDNNLYDHESGFTDDGLPITTTRFAESGAVELGTGDRMIVARQVIPDEKTQGQTRLKFKTRMTPNGTQSEFGPFTMTDYTDVRFTGRQVSMRVEGVVDANWQFGVPRLDAMPGSKR